MIIPSFSDIPATTWDTLTSALAQFAGGLVAVLKWIALLVV